MQLAGAVRGAMLAIVVAMALAPAAQASGGELLGEEDIRRELIGRHAAGIYPSGQTWEETFHADGRATYSEGGETRLGHWALRSGLFCFTYANPAAGGCFQVYRLGPNCYEIYTILEPDEPGARPESREGRSWNGRLWRTGEGSACESWQGS